MVAVSRKGQPGHSSRHCCVDSPRDCHARLLAGLDKGRTGCNFVRTTPPNPTAHPDIPSIETFFPSASTVSYPRTINGSGHKDAHQLSAPPRLDAGLSSRRLARHWPPAGWSAKPNELWCVGASCRLDGVKEMNVAGRCGEYVLSR